MPGIRSGDSKRCAANCRYPFPGEAPFSTNVPAPGKAQETQGLTWIIRFIDVMNSPESKTLRRPSPWWMVLAAVCLLLALGTAVAAFATQRRATEPVGEGVVFVNDASLAESAILNASTAVSGVRIARNTLGLEAVSVVGTDGVVVASTSSPMVGSQLSNDLLLYGATSDRFAALAGSLTDDLWLDGVVAWPAGSVLYQVVSPLTEMDGSLLLHYDVSSLLERRIRPGQIQPSTLQLYGLSLFLLLASAAALFGRARAARRYRLVMLESDLLREYSVRLERVNADLESARNSAEAALALAEEKIRIRSEFVLMINHELRTPLTSVVTGAELIKAAGLSEEERLSLIDSMVDDGNRLLEIIDQILAVVRIENRGLSNELTDVPVLELCSEVGAPFESGAESTWEHGNGLAVRTDAKALKLVMSSLVDNARTHGADHVRSECSMRPLISPSLEVGRRPDHPVYFAVFDDGPGIDPEFLPRIFEKFEKSSFSSGTGLGLYMARMVVEALEGSLSVSSSTLGTSFQIALPLVPAFEAVGVNK